MQEYSENFSFRGWSLWKWIKGNAKTVKELLKIGIPLAIGWTTTNSPELTALVTFFGKFLMDSAEYYLKEYPKES